jgi:hypothetical protein
MPIFVLHTQLTSCLVQYYRAAISPENQLLKGFTKVKISNGATVE